MTMVGIDVSKASFDAAWESEGRHHTQCFDYTDEGIKALLAQVGGEAHFVMEATGVYHSRLALALYQGGSPVSVVNPLVIKRYAQAQLSRVKSDKADAQLVLSYAHHTPLTPWAPSSEEVEALRQAHSYLDDLIGERTRLINRQEAHRHQLTPSAFVRQGQARRLKALERDIRACEAHLEVLVKKSFPELYARLLSIPALGPKTAIEMIIITEAFDRFTDIKALCAYVGVSPTTWRSGTSLKGQGHIAKLGQGRMRQLLYLCSWSAKRCNPPCRALHQRLAAAGKPRKLINIAIAHKLLRQAYAVATQKTVFNPNFA